MTSRIPAFYRICFTVFDLIMPLAGVFGNVFAPDFILKSYTSSQVFPPAPETILLLDAMAGFFAGLAFLHVFLLRANPTNIPVWRAVQGSTVLVDLFMLGGFGRALSTEGRLDPKVWRAEDWGNIGGYAGILFIRMAFILGIGMGRQVKEKRA